MPVLGFAKQRLGARLDSGATAGEGMQNYLCAAQAGAVLLGLAMTASWADGWWLDPVIGLGIAGWSVWEGIWAWRGDDCCYGSPADTTPLEPTTDVERVGKLRNPPTDDFRILLLLPAKPDNGADTTRGQLGCLVEADRGKGRLLAVTIHSHHDGSTDALYVHAKVGVVDDRWLTVGSANLNEHSLFNDTEINIATCDPMLARHSRLALWAEHLNRAVEQIDQDPTTVIDRLWRPIAEEQLHQQRSGRALTHRLMELPAVSRRAERLIGPMRGLLIDG